MTYGPAVHGEIPVHDAGPREVERLELGDFGLRVRQYRQSQGLSLRRAAEVANVSFSTLTRVEGGSQPDLASFTALCAWMGLAPSEFFVPVAETTSGPFADLVAHLRQDPLLTPSAQESIASILTEMYSKLAVSSEPERLVACHLRAASTLRPGVSERLSTLLRDMHDGLVAKVASGAL